VRNAASILLIQELPHEGGDLGLCLARVFCSQHVADRVVCPGRQFADSGAGHRDGPDRNHKEVEEFIQEPFEEEIKKIELKPSEFGEASAPLGEYQQELAA
jgi:hypothetical protein